MNQQIVTQTGTPWWAAWLPPKEVLWEWVAGAIVAFVVIQLFKSWRRHMARKHPNRCFRKLSTFEMMGMTMLLASPSVFWQLHFVHDYPFEAALSYAFQGGVFAPLVITLLLALMERFLPDVKAKLGQDARQRNRGNPNGPDRRDPDDTTSGYL